MRPTTSTALALACAALALPAGVALAQTNDDPPSPAESALAAPFAGHLTMNAHMRAERREALVERLTPRVIRTERRTAHVNGAHFSLRAHKRRLAGQTPAELRHSLHKSRRELHRAKRAAAAERRAAHRRAAARATGTPAATAPTGAAAATGATAPPHLEAIAACESGGDPSANTGNGFYGKYQFTQSTWASVGGTGSPAAASEAEQDARAAQLYAQQGSSPWPVCGG